MSWEGRCPPDGNTWEFEAGELDISACTAQSLAELPGAHVQQGAWIALVGREGGRGWRPEEVALRY